MRKVLLLAAFACAIALGSSSCTSEPNHVKDAGSAATKVGQYNCLICDDPAFAPADCHALVYIVGEGCDTEHHRTAFREEENGTGFVFTYGKSHATWIGTVDHVVRHLRELHDMNIFVYLADMRTRTTVRVVAYNEDADLAVLEFSDPAFHYTGDALELGDDNTLAYGDSVVALGAPFGHGFMESRGVFAERGIARGSCDLLHTAKTASGMSGGPLLDKNGLVVGIIARLEGNGEGRASSGANPVNDLKKLLDASVAK